MRRILTGLAVAGLLAIPAAASATPAPPGQITTAQLNAIPSVPIAGASTSQYDYWCSNDYAGHYACDAYPDSTGSYQFGTFANVNDWPGYALRYSSKYLLLYNSTNGCLHIVKRAISAGGDYANIVTCNTGDKNQRWSFPNSGLEIKSSGDDACFQLTFNIITGYPNGYGMAACNASQSYQNWKWFGPGT